MTRRDRARVAAYFVARLAVLVLLSSASRAFSQSAGLMLDPSQPQPVSPAFLSSPATDFTVSPSIFVFGSCAIPSNQPQTLALVAFCFNSSTGAIIPNCNVQIAVQAEAGSGGHIHTDPGRPAGQFTPSSGNTGPSGFLSTTYTAADVSGVMDATVTGTLPDGTPVTPGTATIGVGLDGLQALPASGPGYQTTTSVGHDSNNLFLNPSVGTELQMIPVDFDTIWTAVGFSPASPPPLVFTSMSLPQGGLFDVDADGDGVIDFPWHPPHCGHRMGTEADLAIRNIPPIARPLLVMIIQDNQFRLPVKSESNLNPNATHWHLRAR